MDIKIDQKILEESINNSATQAIRSALEGYVVKESIVSAVTNEIAEGAVASAIREAVKKINTETLVQHLAKEIERATTKAVIHILHLGLIETICKLRGIGDYSKEDREERRKLEIELFKLNDKSLKK